MEEKTFRIILQPKKTCLILGCIAAFLVLINTGGYFAKYQLGFTKTFLEEFFLDLENNIPTYFTAVILLISAVLLVIVGLFHKKRQGPFFKQWIILSMIAFLISIDEMASLHEHFIFYIRKLLHCRGWFYFGWIIPGFVIMVMMAVMYWKFFWHLPKRTRNLMALAAVIYVSGVIGIDSVGEKFYYGYGGDNLIYAMIETAEESLEVTGIIVFIYTLLDYMNRRGIQLLLAF